MEFAANSINQPVNFYTKNTGNTINMAVNGENKLYSENIFAPEFATKKNIKDSTKPTRKRKTKRLNTLDTEYLPDEAIEQEPQEIPKDNIFMPQEENKFIKNFKKSMENFYTSTPLVNYFFMKKKKQKIEKTVEKLSDINQNVDDLMNTAIPYGEASNVYGDIAKNLTNAANMLGQAKKDL
ncbi:hypothetical protein IJ182_01995 [bacterium]|nr:hypothetical protein [bacterium]